MSTDRAPRATALTTSEPRLIPPSRTTSTWSPTASAMGLTIRMAAGVPSRLLPPWLDTDRAVTPASTARLASSTRQMPLIMNGPPLLAHPLDVLPGGHRGGHPLVVGAEEGRGLASGRG